ncbi:MAG: tripartite tricarboxylate transporter TctB family protein [Deltaproteobacteria bacterium]|nr:tripartite tricarboxylate transporter TctB family protein [Deltaproteobacteria bacterium]
MKRVNLAAAIGLLLLAGFILFESRVLSFGTFRVPHTGFYPKIIIGLLLLLSLCCLAQSLRDKTIDRPTEKIPTEGWIRIGATLATLLGFALVLEWLGFLLSTFFLMVLLLRAIEAPKWSKVIVVASATAALSYGLFAWLLGVPLPVGVLGI